MITQAGRGRRGGQAQAGGRGEGLPGGAATRPAPRRRRSARTPAPRRSAPSRSCAPRPGGAARIVARGEEQLASQRASDRARAARRDRHAGRRAVREDRRASGWPTRRRSRPPSTRSSPGSRRRTGAESWSAHPRCARRAGRRSTRCASTQETVFGSGRRVSADTLTTLAERAVRRRRPARRRSRGCAARSATRPPRPSRAPSSLEPLLDGQGRQARRWSSSRPPSSSAGRRRGTSPTRSRPPATTRCSPRPRRARPLDSVEDELFRFERILDGEGELAALLDEPTVDAGAAHALLDGLVGGKVSPITLRPAAPRGRQPAQAQHRRWPSTTCSSRPRPASERSVARVVVRGPADRRAGAAARRAR